jgi:hypothetical protein
LPKGPLFSIILSNKSLITYVGSSSKSKYFWVAFITFI